MHKAISSVLSQTYQRFEIIIADDGSTDDTPQMIGKLNDDRILHLPLPHTGHIGKIRNAGATAGKGEWIAFLDSDDQWFTGKLEVQINAVRQSGKRWSYTNFDLMDENGEKIAPKAGSFQPLSGWITRQLLTNEATVVVCTLLVERKLFETIGGFSTDERLAYRGDYELALRLSVHAEALALPDSWVNVLEHPGRSTHGLADAHERSAVPYVLFLEQNREKRWRRIAKRRKAYLLAEAAVNRSAFGDHSIAFRHLGRSFSNDNWRHWFSATWRTVKELVNSDRQNRKTERAAGNR